MLFLYGESSKRPSLQINSNQNTSQSSAKSTPWPNCILRFSKNAILQQFQSGLQLNSNIKYAHRNQTTWFKINLKNYIQLKEVHSIRLWNPWFPYTIFGIEVRHVPIPKEKVKHKKGSHYKKDEKSMQHRTPINAPILKWPPTKLGSWYPTQETQKWPNNKVKTQATDANYYTTEIIIANNTIPNNFIRPYYHHTIAASINSS